LDIAALARARLPVLAAAVLATVACGPASPTATSVSTASASPARTASNPSASPLPSGTGVFGTCQLPVLMSGTPPQVGWLDVPGGRFSPDPAGMSAKSLYGNVAWDSGIGKWLPTEPRMISPDGLSYIPEDHQNEILDAQTGAILHVTPPGDYNSVIGWTNAGIYLQHVGKASIPGLWKINPSTGTVTQVQSKSDDVLWDVADDSSAWGTVGDPNALTIARLDLTNGSLTRVYHAPGNSLMEIAGFSGSGVLVFLYEPPAWVGFVLRPDGTTDQVDVPTNWAPGDSNGLIQDGPAILFSGVDYALAAYAPDRGLHVLIHSPPDLFLLGRCVPKRSG